MTNLFGDSKKTNVASFFILFSKTFFLSESFLGKNPKNINLLIGNPDNSKEFITEEGPGITEYSIFSLMHSLTNMYPGSDIKGAPASEINDIVFPALASLIILFVLLLSLWSLKEKLFLSILYLSKIF